MAEAVPFGGSEARVHRVGIIGLTPGRSWSAVTHLPALRALGPKFEIMGVANSRPESAREAADQLGIPKAFASADAMMVDDAIDVVAVTVKVPHHLALVRTAISAGKHVYCEWPLGQTFAETQELAGLAREHAGVAVIGTQGRLAPGFRHVAQLVRSGYIGELLSSTVIGADPAWGEEVSAANAYTVDDRNGATLLTIGMGHVLAVLPDILGEVEDVVATTANRRRSARVAETGARLPMTAPDQVLVQAIMPNGAPLSLHFRGGPSHATPFLWEINGTEGDLKITAPAHSQLSDLTIFGARRSDDAMTRLAIPADPIGAIIPAPLQGNIARVWAAMAADIENGTRDAPGFDDAVATHRLIEAIRQSGARREWVKVRSVV